MLDKLTSATLDFLSKECEDGSYKILKTDYIISSLPSSIKASEEGVADCINHLEDREYLKLKYSEDNTFCLSVLPKGRKHTEVAKEQKTILKKNNRYLKLTVIFAGIASFVGAMLAGVILRIIWG